MIKIFVIQRLMKTDDSKEPKWLDSSHHYTTEDSARDGFTTASHRYPEIHMRLAERVTIEKIVRSSHIEVDDKDDF